MEEAVCACRDSLVAVYTTRADNADGRLLVLHDAALVVGCMRAEQDILSYVVGVLLDEERVLHIASGVIGCEVELGEHVQVVVNLRSFCQSESHTLEYVDDLVLDDVERVACAELYGVCRTGQVEVVSRLFCHLVLLFQLVDFLHCELLQLVNLHSDSLFLVGSHIAEVGHESRNLAFFA